MELSNREIWTVLHGLLGVGFLFGFVGALVGLWSLTPELASVPGARMRLRFMLTGMWLVVVIAWLTSIIGTWLVFAWYRERPPAGVADLTGYPLFLILGDPDTSLYHKLGVSTKEHWGWMPPFLATAAAFVATDYGPRLASEGRMRILVMALLIAAFGIASVVALFGILASRVAPIR